MSVKHAVSRGMELGRSVFQLGLLKPAARLAAKFRGERLRVGPPSRTVQPQTFLPARYRYYRMSLSGLAAQLQSGGFRRLVGGSPRNRVVFLAFGVGLGLIEQQFEDDRKSVAACQQIQALFKKKKFETPLKSFVSGYKLEDYVIGKQIGKGCNAAVYEAAAPFAVPRESEKCSLVELKSNSNEQSASPQFPYPTIYPLAVKMMWNMGAGSSSEAILNSMSQELVPATPHALKQEGELSLNGHFGWVPKTVPAHPNVIRVYRAFTADVALLPGAVEEYPDVLPTRLNPMGVGNNRTLFLVMKNYPCTLRQYLQVCTPARKDGTLMALQLLEGVDHLCRQGIAHRDLKSDNILLEFDSGGCPRLVITDFGCCLADKNCGLQLPYNGRWVSRGGNACLMAPEVATATPGPGVVIDYSKADAWAVGSICYEIFGEPNPFYCPHGLEGRSYQETQLPTLPTNTPTDVQLVVRLLLRRNPKKRPSARVAANMLHLSLWGRRALATLDRAKLSELADWLLCQSAFVLLNGRGPSGSSVEADLQRCFLSNIDLEDLRTAIGFLVYGQQLSSAVTL
ncbi:serine/threonine-protein kinase PINK1, mitochondrial isoform X1 [Alosa sapidissima]|uniref:serine/threonine-protein kinase PINK1, mitochondrial isoform X1 n=1 Tax=Alosa sapidissima TaxID=34773 RepID=UPI001C0A064E|nr:serine/threonine-protein kinase PINK1, mitochondrial isoform X1 [Alosa sapidissima]